MIAGMTTFTFVHVVLSLVGIFSGLFVLYGMIAGKRYDGMTGIFLATTLLTSITGFMFPYHGFTPAIGVGIVSMLILAIALYARYSRHLVGGSRRTYVITAVIALWLNCFVLVAQHFPSDRNGDLHRPRLRGGQGISRAVSSSSRSLDKSGLIGMVRVATCYVLSQALAIKSFLHSTDEA